VSEALSETADRVVRVFVSSTFSDMHAERDELIKQVFPQLRKFCAQRGVSLVDVDLRWGITDEEAAEGRVLHICLAEIEHCRPFFIGVLGERYGSVPRQIPEALLELHPWLAEHRDKSVTELEILHGVLNNTNRASRAIFYFRDPKYLERVPVEQRVEFVEANLVRRGKLDALKRRIAESGLACRHGYPDPLTLGQWVLEDLKAAINEIFPVTAALDPLAREAAEHEAFARSRTGVYVGRQAYFERLDAHAVSDGPPLVVLGESGSGKSALLANWVKRYRRAHPDVPVLVHFISGTPYSSNWAAMLRRILYELKRHFRIQGEIPSQAEAMRAAFASWLHMAAARGRVVLVLDALNQLEDRDGAPDLVWLPPVIPANVRLLLSTLPGRALDDLIKRKWPSLTVEPLEADQRRRLIAGYLLQFTKRLNEGRIARIADAPQSANPLYLRVLLEELRVFGDNQRIDQQIDDYLSARTVPELYEKVLARWEADYQRKRPFLVRDTMTALWSARRGMAEPELLELLGTDGQALPHAHWSPLYLAAESSLVVHSDVIGFSHAYLRQAVQTRYLTTAGAQAEGHLRLADYFHAQPGGGRRVDEEPWQLAVAGSWDRLAALLSEWGFFSAVLAATGLRRQMVLGAPGRTRALDDDRLPRRVGLPEELCEPVRRNTLRAVPRYRASARGRNPFGGDDRHVPRSPRDLGPFAAPCSAGPRCAYSGRLSARPESLSRCRQSVPAALRSARSGGHARRLGLDPPGPG